MMECLVMSMVSPTCWKPCYNLDFTELDVGTFAGVDAARFHGVDDGSISLVCLCHTVAPASACTGAIVEQVQYMWRTNEISILKRRLDHKHAILDENVLICCGGLLELTIARDLISIRGSISFPGEQN